MSPYSFFSIDIYNRFRMKNRKRQFQKPTPQSDKHHQRERYCILSNLNYNLIRNFKLYNSFKILQRQPRYLVVVILMEKFSKFTIRCYNYAAPRNSFFHWTILSPICYATSFLLHLVPNRNLIFCCIYFFSNSNNIYDPEKKITIYPMKNYEAHTPIWPDFVNDFFALTLSEETVPPSKINYGNLYFTNYKLFAQQLLGYY